MSTKDDSGELGPIRFTYRIQDADKARDPMVFVIELDRTTLEHKKTWQGEYPEWTAMDHHRCEKCPLDASRGGRCPAAESMVPLIEPFEEIMSYHAVEVIVEAPERTYSANTTAQRALSSILGLHLATSGCPALGKLKPMARYHLPLGSREETFFRAAGAWLLMNYISGQHGEQPSFDLDGLHALYDEIHQINVAIAKRLRVVTKSDTGLNAITILDLLAQGMPMSIRENLKELEYLYQAMQPSSTED